MAEIRREVPKTTSAAAAALLQAASGASSHRPAPTPAPAPAADIGDVFRNPLATRARHAIEIRESCPSLEPERR